MTDTPDTTDRKLDAILAQVTQMQSWQTGHTIAHEVIGRDVSELRHSVYGNGVPGLKGRVQALELAQPRRTWWSELALGAAKSIAAGVVLAFVAWLLLVYRKLGGQ